MSDPYTLLGVSKDASQSDIKKAYRKLAKTLHPDLNPGKPDVADKFKEVTAAYDLLSDENKRARYDRGEIDEKGNERAGFGFNPNGQGTWHTSGGGFSGFGSSASGANFDFADLFGGAYGGKAQGFDFSDLFGGMKTSRNFKQKGQDINYAMQVSFTEAALGAVKEVVLTGGKRIKVKIPAGTDDGAVLRLKEQGYEGSGGGAKGDAYVKITVLPHSFFKKDGLDVLADFKVDLKTAVLGGTVRAPTLDGEVALKIPPYSNSGKILRLKGKGIAKGFKKGDILLKIVVMLPEHEDKSLTEFMQNWKGGI